MNKGGFIWIAISVVIALVVVGFGVKWILNGLGGSEKNNDTIENITIGGECSVDSDCVPDSCCHPKGCVVKTEKPDCSGSYCTQECVPGTLDCNQGICACENKKCRAVIG